MDNSYYSGINRMTGLSRQMQVVANNLANISTTGFQREGVVFSEYITKLENRDNDLSMANAEIRYFDKTSGGVTRTGAKLDLAIEGEGYFLIETPNGVAMTRSGSFMANAASELVTSDGNRVLDIGQAPIPIPPNVSDIRISEDGTISAYDNVMAQIGIFDVADKTRMERLGGSLVRFQADPLPVETPKVRQGYLENSNVNPILEISRMIDVQRAYEHGANLIFDENDRILSVVKTLGE